MSDAEEQQQQTDEDERRERWRVLQERTDRRRRRTRIAVWCGLGVLVLGGAGWAVTPTVKDSVITSGACDGALPDGTMDTLRNTTGHADGHLTESRSELDGDLGRYSCEVANEEGERVLEVHVYSRRDDIDRELIREFRDDGVHPTSALPGGLPGFESRLAGLTLLPRCPGRGKDAAGNPGRLLVDVLAGHRSEPHQLVRAGAAVANKAAEKLGCDTDPLPVPEKEIEQQAPGSVPSARAAGTTCAALARGPFQDAGWSVDLRIPKGPAPLTSCTVRPSGEDEDGEPHRPVLSLHGLYGEWTQRVMLGQARHHGARTDEKRVGPWLTDESGWAMARCDGRPAGFKISVSRPDHETDSYSEDKTLSRKQLDRTGMRKMLASFAERESAERGCTGLRLPAAD
ncbi:hypothetical protein JW613_29915 [Streptomyces smyrnaeus]|uniref:DUF3558 domain-containing protein n=1 Tax=Streptomyces smyrnaeus TaxID=1387713 RepID=A0ABS3Y481_9ACTN|nr:hypothetical protein [Streptomyces smyrnaeus]MBO8202470.1 hypothetical protein [Streptomyces smyrnaeus]